MAKLLHSKEISSLPIRLDNFMNKYVEINTTTNLNQQMGEYFTCCFKLISDQLKKENALSIKKVHCIITDRDTIEVKSDSNERGLYMELCVFLVHRWKKYNRVQIFTIILEELCHCIWRIEDEVEVKHKVVEVYKQMLPSITIDKLYNI